MTLSKVKKMIADQLGVSADSISENSDLINELNADSLDIVQMLISLENEFDVEFNDDEIKVVKTVGDVVKFIDSRKA